MLNQALFHQCCAMDETQELLMRGQQTDAWQMLKHDCRWYSGFLFCPYCGLKLEVV